MSNILIIKHGSLGDLIQANGAMKDIKDSFPNDKVLLLTTPPYVNFMSTCPYINGVLIDKRLPRWNIFYLLRLRKMLSRFKFEKVFDLQNSSRTNFYRKFFFKGVDWSSSETSLEKNPNNRLRRVEGRGMGWACPTPSLLYRLTSALYAVCWSAGWLVAQVEREAR